jgi:hypothetical protein
MSEERTIIEPDVDIHPPAAVETSDVSISGIAKFGAGLAVGIVASMALIWAVMMWWAAREARPPREISRVARRAEERTPPPPQLLSGTGMRVKPEDLTADPMIQKELSEDDLNYELERPEDYRETLERVKERELSSYGAIRQAPGQPVEYRIPINEAKRLLIERLRRAAPSPSPQPPPAASQAAARGEGYVMLPTAASSGRVYESMKGR